MGRLPSGWFGQKARSAKSLPFFILQGRPKAGEEFIRSPRRRGQVDLLTALLARLLLSAAAMRAAAVSWLRAFSGAHYRHTAGVSERAYLKRNC